MMYNIQDKWPYHKK